MKAFPDLHLTNEKIHTNGEFFEAVSFSGKHQAGLQAVIKGDVDIVPISDQIMASEFKNGNADENAVKVVHSSAAIPAEAMVVSKTVNEDLKKTLTKFLVEYNNKDYFDKVIKKADATVDWLNMLRKYMPFKEYTDIDGLLCSLRLVKSSYELELMKRSGAIHQTVLEQLAPKMIKEGISEAELAVSLYTEMLKRGSHGIARMNLPLGEDVIGVASFGKSGLVRTAFDGPGGTGGTCIAVQSIGSPFRKLKAGRLVYLDIPCGVEGYHTDKTIVYYFGDINKDPNRDLILAAHEHCIMLERFAAAMLKPGTVVEDIYNETMKQFDSRFAAGFMNGGKFLGHSIGLTMDESPAIANRFKEVLTEGMTFALEPKIALPGIGMVGSENTYLVTANGGKALTGSPHKLYCIY